MKGRFVITEEGDSKVFVAGDILSIGTKVEAISKRGNPYNLVITQVNNRIEDGYLYAYRLADDYNNSPRVDDLDELLGLL